MRFFRLNKIEPELQPFPLIAHDHSRETLWSDQVTIDFKFFWICCVLWIVACSGGFGICDPPTIYHASRIEHYHVQ